MDEISVRKRRYQKIQEIKAKHPEISDHAKILEILETEQKGKSKRARKYGLLVGVILLCIGIIFRFLFTNIDSGISTMIILLSTIIITTITPFSIESILIKREKHLIEGRSRTKLTKELIIKEVIKELRFHILKYWLIVLTMPYSFGVVLIVMGNSDSSLFYPILFSAPVLIALLISLPKIIGIKKIKKDNSNILICKRHLFDKIALKDDTYEDVDDGQSIVYRYKICFEGEDWKETSSYIYSKFELDHTYYVVYYKGEIRAAFDIEYYYPDLELERIINKNNIAE